MAVSALPGKSVEKKTYSLVHDIARRSAAMLCFEAPDGWVVKFSPPVKSREQEEKYHSMIDDIAAQAMFMGQKWCAEDWKRLLIDAYVRIARENAKAEGKPDPFGSGGKVIPSLDGLGFVQLGVQSRSLKKKQAAELIEYLYAFGEENHVRWSDASKPVPNYLG